MAFGAQGMAFTFFFFNVSQSALLVYFHLVVSEINFPKSRYSSHTIKQNKLNYNLFLGNK